MRNVKLVQWKWKGILFKETTQFFTFRRVSCVSVCMNTLKISILLIGNTGFNSTGERAPIDGVGEQI